MKTNTVDNMSVDQLRKVSPQFNDFWSRMDGLIERGLARECVGPGGEQGYITLTDEGERLYQQLKLAR
jgi:hypothetical protein